MDEGEEGFANNGMELDACLWLVRAAVDSDKRKGCRSGPGQGPCLKVPCEILRCTHMPATVHSTTDFVDEGLNE